MQRLEELLTKLYIHIVALGKQSYRFKKLEFLTRPIFPFVMKSLKEISSPIYFFSINACQIFDLFEEQPRNYHKEMKRTKFRKTNPYVV